MKNNFMPFLLLALFSCAGDKEKYDASGVFEADETVISAQATGEIRELRIEEGMELNAGEVLGYIDSTQLYLRKKQLLAQSKAVLSRSPDINMQLAALEEQLKQAKREQQRIQNLVKAGAATEKQLDDINSQVSILEKQAAASRSSCTCGPNATTRGRADAMAEQLLREADDYAARGELGQARLHRPVRLHGAVPVEVILADVRVQGDIGPAPVTPDMQLRRDRGIRCDR